MNKAIATTTLVMKELCSNIGPRATGSRANQMAVSYAADMLRKFGCDVSLQAFDCMDWADNGGRLAVDGKRLPVYAADYSLPCDVTGALVFASTMEELQHAELGGKICVLHGDIAAEELMPKSMVFWNPEEHKAIIKVLEDKAPLALITVSSRPDRAVPIIQDGDFTVPCAVVAGNQLDSLLSGKTACLQLFTERRPSTGANVIAKYGTGGHRVCFSAHIDTKPTTPGALDNASGVAVLLALAERVTQKQVPCQIEYVLFNGEDHYSMPGEMAFLGASLQEPGRYAYAFNVDGVGMKGSSTSCSFYECPEALQTRISGLASQAEAFESVEPWPMGDHMLFASRGVPAIALTSTGIFSLVESVLHTPRDDLSQIDFTRLEQVVSFLFRCL